MIEYLLVAGIMAEIGVARSVAGEQVDFGAGASCMLMLPKGFIVNAHASDKYIILFERPHTDDRRVVRGSARVRDEPAFGDPRDMPGTPLRRYKNATIETSGADVESGVFGFEIVIGRQVIRFNSLTKSALPDPEDIVDACGSGK